MKGYEYHVFAKFKCNASGVRVGIALTERTAQKIGNKFYSLADEVWYTAKPRLGKR